MSTKVKLPVVCTDATMAVSPSWYGWLAAELIARDLAPVVFNLEGVSARACVRAGVRAGVRVRVAVPRRWDVQCRACASVQHLPLHAAQLLGQGSRQRQPPHTRTRPRAHARAFRAAEVRLSGAARPGCAGRRQGYNARKCAVAVGSVVEGLSAAKTAADFVAELGLASKPGDHGTGYPCRSGGGGGGGAAQWLKRPGERAQKRMDKTRAIQLAAVQAALLPSGGGGGGSGPSPRGRRRLSAGARPAGEGMGAPVQL